ncbi:hypothetical protein [Butyrivibrio fibrisolvens]|jgi:hypothetical protein|uniref:hypothetical protein n=1 Tax=Butyrivibrio fibrisolvens TaxID=831 RepID=UPI0003B594C7|nr:hypothetical protein [Butyrivibrio fibrisolvens]
MEKYDILNKARKMTDPSAKKVSMTITTLDPDAPYKLTWDITLDIPDFVSYCKNSGEYVFDFLISFSSLLLDVCIN